MKFLLIGDIHFRPDNVIETEKLKKTVFDILDTYDIDYITIMGDTLDRYEKINSQCLTRACKFIFELSDIKETFVLIGNHDKINENELFGEENPFIGMERYDKIHIIKKPFLFKRILMLPHIPVGYFNEYIAEYEGEYDCIFAHQDLKGWKSGNIVKDTGDCYDKKEPIYSGHIHTYQTVNNKIVYTGAPFQHAFGDTLQKYLIILDTEKIKNYKKIEDTFIKIETDIVKKRIVRLKEDELQNFKEEDNCIYKIMVEGNSRNIKDILKRCDIKSKVYIKNKINDKEKKKEKISFKKRLENAFSEVDIDIADEFKKLFS